MIQLAWQRIKHRKQITFIVLLSFICLFIFIPIGLHQSKASKAVVDTSIEEHGRGAYDLLVRPPHSRTKIEKKMGSVEENYIGDGTGGISIDEWKEMKKDQNIEIAAPVASLGYFRGIQYAINIPTLNEPTRFTYQFFTSDGKTKYPLTSEKRIMYFEGKEDEKIQYISDRTSTGSTDIFMATEITPVNFNLLVGIDPESENALTGIDFSPLEDKEITPPQKHYYDMVNPDIPLINILQRDDLNVPLIFELSVETMEVNINDYLKLLGINKDDFMMSVEDVSPAFEQLSKEDVLEHKQFHYDLSTYTNPFDGETLRLNDSFELVEDEQGSFLDFDTSTYFTASKIDYTNLNGIPKVAIQSNDTPPIYKKVEEKGIPLRERNEQDSNIPFFIAQIGTFAFSTNTENQLAGSPLGIYGEMEARAEDGTILTPTISPGSFIPSPASGVTTIENATLIKGESPIDAVRVRVAGIQSYDDAGREKIEKVATSLLKAGYEVDIVAGSSIKKMKLDVEDIGIVTENWTTLGVAQELSETWDVMNVLTTFLLGLFAILWLLLRLIYEKHIFIPENQTLRIIGWSKNKITLRNCMEQYLVITTAFGISLVILFYMKATFVMYGGATLFWFLSVVLCTVLLNRKEKETTRTHPYNRYASILYYKRLILPLALITCLAISLISMQLAAFGDSMMKASETRLGLFIGEETMWFQIAISALVIFLCTVAFNEGLNTLLVERKQEFNMYYQIGWSKRKILSYIWKESATWFLFSITISLIMNGAVLFLIGIPFFWIGIGSAIAVFVLGSILSTVLLTRRYISIK